MVRHLIETLENFKSQLPETKQQSPLGPSFLSLVEKLNQQILRSYNHCYEIASFIDSAMVTSSPFSLEKVPLVLTYTSDKDRLEIELRKSLLIRLIEQRAFSKEKEQELNIQLN